jgi:predicted nuclease with TOPRIM domain
MYDVTITFANASDSITVSSIEATTMEEAAAKAAQAIDLKGTTFYKTDGDVPEGKEVVARFKITTRGYLIHARERGE